MASRRGYLSQAELAEYADITITNTTEADDQISMAEELIDEYVGFQDKFIDYEIRGLISSGGTNSLTMESTHQNNMQLNYLRGCWFEIIGGSGEGLRRKITTQTYAGVLTLESALTTSADTTSYYRIWQLGKFPRFCDTQFDSAHSTQQYYKSIPEKVRRATAAQVEYMINMGATFFSSDKLNMKSERIGDYMYDRGDSGGGAIGVASLIAPKAKILLKGIMNRTGQIV